MPVFAVGAPPRHPARVRATGTGTPHPRTPQNPTNSARIRLNGCGVRHFLRRCRLLTTLDTDGAKAYRFSIVAIFDMEDAVGPRTEGLTP
jgi:hypothetical protein